MAAPLRVLISYRHESGDHAERVRALCKQLRRDGVDAIIDRFVPAPVEGWSWWMENELEKADRVIVVCSKGYYESRSRSKEVNDGHGSSWEWHLIRRELYNSRGAGDRFMPVIFDHADEKYIPPEVWDQPRHCLKNLFGEEYAALLRNLQRLPEHSLPPLGAVVPREIESDGAGLSTNAAPPSVGVDAANNYPQLVEYLEGCIKQVRRELKADLLKLDFLDQHKAVAPLFSYEFMKVRQATSDNERVPAVVFRSLEHAFQSHHQRLLLLGPPGAGKTFGMLDLMAIFAYRRLEDPTAPVPVWLSLHEWDGRSNLRDCAIKSRDPNNLADLAGQPLILLLDGLDEVTANLADDQQNRDRMRQASAHGAHSTDRSGDARKLVAERLLTELERSPDQPVVVTCRIADYQHWKVRPRIPGAVAIQPLNVDAIRAYLISLGADTLWLKLKEDADLLQLVRTPLHFGMLLAIWRERPGAIVEVNKSDLFARFVDSRFKWESDHAPLEFSEVETQCMLQRLAASQWMDHSGSVSFAFTEVGKLLGWFNRADRACRFVSFCVERMAFLKRSADHDQILQFQHLELRNYFAVSGLIDLARSAKLGRYERARAIESLGKIGDKREDLQQFILHISEHDPEGYVRQESVKAFETTLPRDLAVGRLRKAIHSLDAEIPKAAVGPLARLDGTNSEADLIELLNRPASHYRWFELWQRNRFIIASAVLALILGPWIGSHFKLVQYLLVAMICLAVLAPSARSILPDRVLSALRPLQHAYFLFVPFALLVLAGRGNAGLIGVYGIAWLLVMTLLTYYAFAEVWLLLAIMAAANWLGRVGSSSSVMPLVNRALLEAHRRPKGHRQVPELPRGRVPSPRRIESPARHPWPCPVGDFLFSHRVQNAKLASVYCIRPDRQNRLRVQNSPRRWSCPHRTWRRGAAGLNDTGRRSSRAAHGD